ncbi:hypothetical protein GGTG_12573 [Gaeumannomyces tritici R3-111a-1]|uniref:F-box domain-containing protein n=1 Tax=Gaeumannomyces tritici (strain R3-111a-1) TaxID=644352 RepID=J3PGE8_GAET3|nr:hypothetical protein GGTG_12573 [Gaeumannomyces tritici R3-111a-1]EJT69690.1 hypothetical protein GGTG_12573 [Gaeumannomyces tritici R3-111a-1]
MDTADYLWLEALPAELMVEIASYLEGSNLVAFRHASSQLSTASSGVLNDHFFGCLTTDLTRRSLSRLFGAARSEGYRRRARALRIAPWACPPSRRMYLNDRPHDWARDAATGRLNLATPTGRAVLACMRDGLPACRSFAVSDSGWLDPDLLPSSDGDDGPHLYPTDALALVAALAGDPANPAPVEALDVSLYGSGGIREDLLDPEALRRADWSALETLRFDVSDMAAGPHPPAGPSGGAAVLQPFIHGLLSSAPNLQTVTIGGTRSVITYCLLLLSEQKRAIRHMTITGRPGRLTSVTPAALCSWIDSNLGDAGGGGEKLESLEFERIFLDSNNTADGANPWPEVISRVHAAFPNLKRFKIMECGATAGLKLAFVCPLLQSLTDRLGPAAPGCPDDGGGGLYHVRCCAAISDEYGGAFRLVSAPSLNRDLLEHSGSITSAFHDTGVEYKLGPSGTAEGMRRALDDIAQGMMLYSPGNAVQCPGRQAPTSGEA